MNTKLLRQKILDLAIRGKLTEQKKSDGTTKDLLAQISKQWLVSSKQDSQKENASSNVIASTTSTSSRTPIRDPFAASKNSDDVIASTAKQSKKKTFAPKEIIPLDKSEAPFEIPENWEWVRLGDVAYIASGSTPSKDCFVDEGVPYLKMYNLRNQQIDFDYKPQFVKREIHERKLARSRTKPYDVIMNIVGPPLGKIALIPESLPECNFNQAAVLIRAHYETRLMNQYIRFYLMQMGEINSINTKGTAGQENLSLSQTQNMRLPLPPLAEQQRIVAAIENAFAEITEIENNQELLKKHIKQGRQKILDLAIRGKLTQQLKTDGTTKDLLAQISKQWLVSSKQESQKENVSFNVIANTTSTSSRTPIRDPFAASKNSDNVIASTAKQSKKNKTAEPKQIIPLDKSETPFEIPENWEWVRLGDVCELLNGDRGTNYPSKNDYIDEGIPFINAGCLNDGIVDYSKSHFISECKFDSLRAGKVQRGDVLYCLRGSLGKCGVIDHDNPAAISSSLCIFRFCLAVNHIFAIYFLQSTCVKNQQNFVDNGTAQPNLSAKDVAEYSVPLPPLAEQQRIVAAIESAFAEFDAMEKGIL